ncbi:uncharacterized protein LOC129968336 [Argiope bruennichi]|uniref:uncharacterized protein LOC129968336 n=1 Tax=Argiope bruennichi TaxID=94029 RepID=UPI002494E37C|nr:uncharacterized protein LOC129968336 [Argiope bruennichi]
MSLPYSDVEPHSLKSCLSPSEGLPRVYFHFDLSIQVTRKDLIPDNLKQLTLEIINVIPYNAIKIFTDGSRLNDHAGSGIYIEKPRDKLSISFRNPDFSSVFKSELIAIEHSLEAIRNENDFGDLWIFSDSRSSLQHIHNWITVGDQTSISILIKFRLISDSHDVHFQWIPLHVDIHGNERADSLVKEGCSHSSSSSSALKFFEH